MTLESVDAKKISRGISADMSPEAVSRRLQICSDLSAACRELGKAVAIAGTASDHGKPNPVQGTIMRAET